MGQAGIYLILAFVGFVLFGALVRWYFRRLRRSGEATGLGLEDLGSLKKHLSEEEYRRVRQKLVERVTQESEEGTGRKRELSLAELEAMALSKGAGKKSGQSEEKPGPKSGQ